MSWPSEDKGRRAPTEPDDCGDPHDSDLYRESLSPADNLSPRAKELLERKSMYTDPTTGAQKEQGIVRMDLLSVDALVEEAAVYGFGASKYADHNWRRGYPWSLSLAALHRHLLRFQAGETYDPESGLHHLAHVRWHAATLIEYDTTHPTLDDRYRP